SIAAHGDRETFWNRNGMYPQMGYDGFWGIEKFDQKDMLKMSSNIGLGLSDESFFQQCAIKMEALKEPYMISLITLTSHAPFVIPDGVKKTRFDGVENMAVRRYLESISYMDGAIGDFVKALDDNGTLNRSLLVIYGDHEGLNKYYGNLEEEWDNRGNLPLIICSEGLPAEIYESCGGQIDIMPTLMHIMGEETEGKKLMGQNLLVINNNEEDERYVSSKERLLSEIVIKSLTSMPVSKD
ncbi:MAG TPA: sulfatase-like hydrolase/transferase, partial [Clostridia bacterium]|nr:sulfatase-like hydrolase/transferase [Clostridia bacterium]